MDTKGNLYGTTIYGGSGENGTVFKLSKAGQLTTLYTFCSQTNCTDGEYPMGSLLRDSQGNLYGTTQNGGTYNDGIVYKLSPNGKFTVLHNFTGGTDGGYPYAGLVQDAAGNLYGTALYGGSVGIGTVWKLTP
jgi:uncharacterized repeat protein (TIGR03803 family)